MNSSDNPQSKIQNPKSGDTGHPSMLEELARGIPGSFVATRNSGTSEQRNSGKAGGVDGGFITGPGLDHVQHVTGVVGECGLRGPAANIEQKLDATSEPDHRAFDAVMKLEAEREAAALAAGKLIQARALMIDAWRLLQKVGEQLPHDQQRHNVAIAAGLDRFKVMDIPCPCPCGQMRRIAQVDVPAGDGTFVQLLWEIKL